MKTINLHKFPLYGFDGEFTEEKDIYRDFTNTIYKNMSWEDLPKLESLRDKEGIELTEEMTEFFKKYLRSISPAIYYISFEKFLKDENS